MGTVSTLLAPDNTTTANLRLWGSAVSNALTAFGLVKTADTGQIDWTTVVTSTSTGAVFGYEIRRFADSLQSTYPVFMKLNYKNASGSNTTPAIAITFGTGSNGTGTLTGSIGSSIEGTSQTVTSTTSRCYMSGNTNGFRLGMFTDISQGAWFLSVERTKSSLGVDNDEGLLVHSKGFNPGGSVAINSLTYIPFTGTATTITDSGILLNTATTTGSIGINFNLFPSYPYNIYSIVNPGVNYLGYFNGDIISGQIVPVTIYGTTRSYMTLGNSFSYITNNARGNSPTSIAIAMLYE